MKKNLLYLILIFVGIGIGFLMGKSSLFDGSTKVVELTEDVESDTTQLADNSSSKVNNKKKKPKEKPSDTPEKDVNEVDETIDSLLVSDSLDIEIDLDSLDNDLEPEDEVFEVDEDDEEDIIIQDELISQQTLTVSHLPADTTDASELLEMNPNAFSDEVLVEFWHSPLNITGYELSRSKLKLFGFNPKEKISLATDQSGTRLLLNTDSMSLVLEKSNRFKTLNLK